MCRAYVLPHLRDSVERTYQILPESFKTRREQHPGPMLVCFPTRQDSLPKRPTQREYSLIAGTAKRIVPYLYSTPDTQLIVPRFTPESPEFYPIIPRYRCVTQVTLS